MVSGVRVHIAGSAAVDTDGALLTAAHATVRALARKLIDEGLGLVVGIGDEQIGDSGVPCTFDWTVIETIVSGSGSSTGAVARRGAAILYRRESGGVRPRPA